MAPSSSSSSSFSSGVDERLTTLLSSSSSDFSVPSYLNLALGDHSSGGGGEDKKKNEKEKSSGVDAADEEAQQSMAQLALQLQLQTQSCHDEIGRIGAELQAVLPRCAADIGRLKVGLEGMEVDATNLVEAMESARSGSGDGGRESSRDSGRAQASPLSTLSTLHALRAHLSATRSILSAASSWDEVIQTIPALLSSQPPDLPEAVRSLARLEAGARALQGMPEGRDEREAALARLRLQMEALLKPQLLHALKKMDSRLGPLQQCLAMYRSLGKLDLLKDEYVRQRPTDVHSLWFAFGAKHGQDTQNGGSTNGPSNGPPNGPPNGPLNEQSEEQKDATDGFYDPPDFDFDEPNEDATNVTNNNNTVINATQFVQWLPTWYESILELLSEERRRAKSVFGPEMAPVIVARVLSECFRPILTSFQTRLKTVCWIDASSASPIKHTTPPGGSLENIATTYEATLRFLSLAYEQMEAWEGVPDKDKSNTLDAKDVETTLRLTVRTIREAFLSVASVFRPYQRQLASLEQRHAGEASVIVAKDVRAAVVSGMAGRNLASFQDASERLGDLAPFMFPLAEAAITRFELLNSGYNPTPTLASIDTLLSDHASELSMSMRTLSGHATAATAAEFDEQFVHCALDILRTAGLFRRNLKAFERSLRERCALWAETMSDPSLEGDTLPDNLSIVQLRAMLAKAACGDDLIDDGTGNKLPSSAIGLRRLAKEIPLLPKSHESAGKLARSCQSFVFEVCYASPERQLHAISALPVWKTERGGKEEEQEQDAYGILPQSFITQVGEHMLALVQALEPFASDEEALGLAMDVMDGVRHVADQQWKEFVAAAGCDLTSDQLEELMKGGNELALMDGMEESSPLDEQDDDEDEDKASEAFCNQWLDAVGAAVTGRLLERTMRIPRLGRRGGEHLAADLNYIRNVFSALGVAGHPHTLLGYVAKLVVMEGGELRNRLKEKEVQTKKGGVGEVIRKVELRIAYVRSIPI